MPLHLIFRFPRAATGLCTSRTRTPARARGRSWTAAASTATPRTTPAARAAAPADTPSSSRGRTSGPSPRRSVRKIFEPPLKNIYCTTETTESGLRAAERVSVGVEVSHPSQAVTTLSTVHPYHAATPGHTHCLDIPCLNNSEL